MSFFNKQSNIKISMLHTENNLKKSITEFWFRLNKNVTKLNVIILANNDEDKIYTDQNEIYLKHQWYLLAGYEDIKYKKWKFVFNGFDMETETHFNCKVKYLIK